jgi:hypothetical protein
VKPSLRSSSEWSASDEGVVFLAFLFLPVAIASLWKVVCVIQYATISIYLYVAFCSY